MASSNAVKKTDRREVLESMSREELLEEALRLDKLINNPQVTDFIEAVKTEAAFQREKWGEDHDAMKSREDWYWVLGFLGGKAIRPEANKEKRLHRIIATAALCLNWYRHEVRRSREE